MTESLDMPDDRSRESAAADNVYHRCAFLDRAALPSACGLLCTGTTSSAWGMEQADAQLRGDTHA